MQLAEPEAVIGWHWHEIWLAKLVRSIPEHGWIKRTWRSKSRGNN